MDHCVIEYAGANAAPEISIYGGSPSITNTIIRNGAGEGINIGRDTVLLPSFSGNTITGNKGAALDFPAACAGFIAPDNSLKGNKLDLVVLNDANVPADAEWRFTAAPFRAMSGIQVESPTAGASTLTIDPGVTVQFADNQRLRLGYINGGVLKAVGTAAAPIVFTSTHVPGSPGDWNGVDLTVTGDGTDLEYVRVEYAGQKNSNAAIYMADGARGVIANCTIAHSAGGGIALGASKVTQKDNTFIDVAGPQVTPAP